MTEEDPDLLILLSDAFYLQSAGVRGMHRSTWSYASQVDSKDGIQPIAHI